MAKIELNEKDFLKQVESNWVTYSKDIIAGDLHDYMIEKGFTNLKKSTLKSKTKPQLKAIILEGANPMEEKPKVKSANNGTNGLASDVINVLDELKKELKGSNLNKFIKERAIKSIESILNKIEDTSKLDNLGTIGNVLIFVLTLLDVFVDIKTIPKKIRAFKEKRAKQTKKVVTSDKQ